MKLIDWLGSLVALGLILMGFELHGLNERVGVLVHSRMVDTQNATSRWREMDGIALSISTYRDPIETEEEFVKRHQAAVEAMTKRVGDSARSERVEHR